jgi:hypothetical protein
MVLNVGHAEAEQRHHGLLLSDCRSGTILVSTAVEVNMPRRIEDAVKAANRSDTSVIQPEGKLVAEAYQTNEWTPTEMLYTIAFLLHELNQAEAKAEIPIPLPHGAGAGAASGELTLWIWRSSLAT